MNWYKKFIFSSVWTDVSKKFISQLVNSGQTVETATSTVTNYIQKFRNAQTYLKEPKYFEKLKQVQISVPPERMKDISAYSNFQDLKAVVDFIEGQVNTQKPQKTQKPQNIVNDSGKNVYRGTNIEIDEGAGRQACINLKGEYNFSWCISRPDASNMYNYYRYNAGEPSFYFVKNLQKIKNNIEDPYSFFIIRIDNRNIYTVTNNRNDGDQEMSWEQIVAIEPQLSNLQHLFTHHSLEPKDRETYKQFQKQLSDQEFAEMAYEDTDLDRSYYKDKQHYIDVYINSPNKTLTDRQFDSCPIDLQNKYISLGTNLTSHQFDVVKQNKQLLNRFGEICKRRGTESLNAAIETKNIEMVEFVSGFAKPNNDSLNIAIRTKNIEMVKLVSGLGAKPNENSLDRAINRAIETDNIEMVKFVSGLGAKPDYDSLNKAIQTNNIEMVKFVLGLGAKPNDAYGQYSLNCAIETDNIEMVKFVSGLGAKPDYDSLDKAINTKNIEIVKFVSGLAEPEFSSLNNAIKTNNIKMVEFVLGLGAKTNEYSLNYAIETNNIEMIKFILGLGAKPNHNSLNYAISTKNIKMVEFVLGLGAKLSADSLNYANGTGNPEIIALVKQLVTQHTANNWYTRYLFAEQNMVTNGRY